MESRSVLPLAFHERCPQPTAPTTAFLAFSATDILAALLREQESYKPSSTSIRARFRACLSRMEFR